VIKSPRTPNRIGETARRNGVWGAIPPLAAQAIANMGTWRAMGARGVTMNTGRVKPGGLAGRPAPRLKIARVTLFATPPA